MRIAIDARELSGRPTGVGRYLTEILRAWEDLPGARLHEFILCATEPVRLHSALAVSVVTGRGRGTLWEQLTLPRLLASAQADVLFAPAYSGPLAGSVPMVVAVHDVSFSAHPEWFSAREGLRRRWLATRAARKAARVITISDFSKQEIVRYLGVPQSKVEVIYPGATLMPATADPQAATPHADLEALILFVGSLFTRRHIPELVDGFARLAARHPAARLDLVGDNRTQPRVDIEQLIAASPARDRIRARAYVTDDELAGLYRRARVFVFLSDYEGFALTPLEALGAGIPIVLLATAVAREIYGPAATYVERPEPGLIAAALERALFDESERARTLGAAPAQIERYSWRESAQRTLQVLLAVGRSG